MKISAVLARFYRSFNYDYLRRWHPEARPVEWEKLEGAWQPYVRIGLEPSVTTVVGANESGKSHLLSAIEAALRGDELDRSDFCRYSPRLTVRLGELRLPDLGLELSDLTSEDRSLLSEVTELPRGRFDSFSFLADGDGSFRVGAANGEVKFIDEDAAKRIRSALPVASRIYSDVALPSLVPLDRLGTKGKTTNPMGRSAWMDLLFGDAAITPEALAIARAQALAPRSDVKAEEEQLAVDLLRKVAGIAPEIFDDLASALKDGPRGGGYANSLIEHINRALASALNFPRHWVQDREFELLVSPRQYDLVFTIRDRTATEYSFGERSLGLRFFLSYYVQLLTHRRPSEGRTDVLLMDEPDSFLSSEGQQDLLRALEEFAADEGEGRRQVVYVTHSPYLINRNHGERIRVLEKGVRDEGTRVVANAARNHYEPLRSALGVFAGESVFIGGGNVVVEGQADQVLVAGAAALLQRRGASRLESLDLNETTVVPAGGAQQVPYVVYLARGRDDEKPAVVVLLDSDPEGDLAVAELKKGRGGRPLLRAEYILQVGDLLPAGDAGVKTLEDLVPPILAAAAVRRYAKEFRGVAEETLVKVTADAIEQNSIAHGLFKAAEMALQRVEKGAALTKLGFARMVIAEAEIEGLEGVEREARDLFLSRMKEVLGVVSAASSAARAVEDEENASRRFARQKATFLVNTRTSSTKEEAQLLLRELRRQLEAVASDEADKILTELIRLERDFALDEDPRSKLQPFGAFVERLHAIQYVSRRGDVSSVDLARTRDPHPRAPAEGTKSGANPKKPARTQRAQGAPATQRIRRSSR